MLLMASSNAFGVRNYLVTTSSMWTMCGIRVGCILSDQHSNLQMPVFLALRCE